MDDPLGGPTHAVYSAFGLAQIPLSADARPLWPMPSSRTNRTAALGRQPPPPSCANSRGLWAYSFESGEGGGGGLHVAGHETYQHVQSYRCHAVARGGQRPGRNREPNDHVRATPSRPTAPPLSYILVDCGDTWAIVCDLCVNQNPRTFCTAHPRCRKGRQKGVSL